MNQFSLSGKTFDGSLSTIGASASTVGAALNTFGGSLKPFGGFLKSLGGSLNTFGGSLVPRPRLHIISLVHTETTREYDWCAFTAKARKFVTMMTSIGYDV